jgi:hypothetical protein
MIRYTLKCAEAHNFDSWFQSADAFDKLVGAGMVSCSVCGSAKVEKAIMAPVVRPARKGATPAAERPLSAPATPAEQAFRELRQKIEANSENVGKDFAREARAIHDGDAPERPIIGEARPEEAKSLIEDGIPVAPLPWFGRKSN